MSSDQTRPLLSVDAALERAAEALGIRFNDVFSPETVRDCLVESYALLDATARIKQHLPLLAERFTADRLNAAARNQGATVTGIPEVLFVCVHNAGRSQMAAALLHHHAAGRVHVRSAGSAPADSINPAVAQAMSEIGLDLSAEYPKPLTDDVVRASDVVITMGCGDACPIYPGKRYLNWELPDPAGKTIEEIRPIRDDIDQRIQALLAELVTET
ncbi:MAG: arsenate reductase ArsC [Actinomycetes bacterium]|jgi:protein-tyrosine-phosphatase